MARHLVLALLLSRSAAALNFTYVGCVAADPRALMRVDPTPTCNDACAAEGSSFAAMAYDGCYCQHLTGPEAARMRMYAVAKESRCTTSCNATMGANLKCGNDEHQKKQRRRPFAFYKRQDPPQAKKELPGDLLKGKKELPADLLNGKDGLPTDLLKSTGLLPGDLLKTENGLPAELIKAKNSLPVDFLKSKDAESDDLLTDVGRKVLHLDQVLDGLDVPTQLVKPVQAVQTSKPGQPSQSSQPSQPVQSSKPVEPPQPVQSSKPVQPPQPVQPSKPIEPPQPVQTVHARSDPSYDTSLAAALRAPCSFIQNPPGRDFHPDILAACTVEGCPPGGCPGAEPAPDTPPAAAAVQPAEPTEAAQPPEPTPLVLGQVRLANDTSLPQVPLASAAAAAASARMGVGMGVNSTVHFPSAPVRWAMAPSSSPQTSRAARGTDGLLVTMPLLLAGLVVVGAML